MKKETRESLARVIEYLCVDEKKDYEAGDPDAPHIYKDLVKLDAWLEESQKCYSMVHDEDIKNHGHCLECQNTK